MNFYLLDAICILIYVHRELAFELIYSKDLSTQKSQKQIVVDQSKNYCLSYNFLFIFQSSSISYCPYFPKLMLAFIEN